MIWGGEFGRLPVAQKAKKPGRDHNPHAFTFWFAGGGVKSGVSYGATDEVGFKAVENRVSVHDLHATILYLLGLDHERLTYRYNGRDFRLTDVEGRVIHDIIVGRSTRRAGVRTCRHRTSVPCRTAAECAPHQARPDSPLLVVEATADCRCADTAPVPHSRSLLVSGECWFAPGETCAHGRPGNHAEGCFRGSGGPCRGHQDAR